MKTMTIFVLAFTCADLHMDAQQKLCLSLDDMFAVAETNSREIRVSMSGHEVAEEEVLLPERTAEEETIRKSP